MTNVSQRFGLLALTLLLVACGATLSRAPVENRVIAPQPVIVANQAEGFENADKPGYYSVKPGDNLLRIAMAHGHSMQELAQWNQIDDPNRIEVGQVLRLTPPTDSAVLVKPVAKPQVSVSTTTATPTKPPASTSTAVTTQTATASSASPTAAPTKPAPVAAGANNWLWPASGAVLAKFDEVKNKGLDIGGKVGDPVLATAAGRVVYVGAGLRGYGKLIILKHNNNYLSAYAHNQSLLVKEDQNVAQGQKIATMGDSEAERVKLHFEIRHQGKPVDPLQYLPAR